MVVALRATFAAVRALAFKWIRTFGSAGKRARPHNEVSYLESLRKKGSSLLNLVLTNPG